MTGRGRAGVRLVTLAVVGLVAACTRDVPVAPLPVRPPAATTPGAPAPPSPAEPVAGSPTPTTGTPTGTPTTRRPAPVIPTVARTPSATPSASGLPSTCLGAVRYDLEVAGSELALLTSLCFATGGVLRIIGIGPGEVTVDREDLVSRTYAAGVVDVRFVRPGTVAVRIPQDTRTYTVTVVVR